VERLQANPRWDKISERCLFFYHKTQYMTTRQIVEEVISQYLEIATNSNRRVSLKNKIDRITVELEKKINDKRNVVRVEEKSFPCKDCPSPITICLKNGKCNYKDE